MSGLNLSGLGGLADDMDTAQDLRRIKSYLIQLTEQLRYVLNNLGEENMTPELVETITTANERVQRVVDEMGNYTTIAQTAEAIRLEAARVDGEMAALSVRADGIEITAQTADGNATTAVIMAGQASTTASNAAGLASEAKQTAEAFSWRLALGTFEARIANEKNNPSFPDNYEYGLYLYLNNVYYGGVFVNSTVGGFGVGTYQQHIGIYGQTVYMRAGTGSINDVTMILGSGQTSLSSHFLPNVNDAYNVGAPGYRWKQGFWTTAANVSSDLRLKQDVDALNAADLLDRLMPIRYRLKSDPKKLHFGFGAQHVQETLRGTGLEDIALLADEDPGHLGLCYEELIAVLVEGHQKQQREIDQLRADMTAALNRIAALEGKA